MPDPPVNESVVRLTVPAVPEYARLARLTAASLATRVGFTYDEVEDLRIAMGEACALLIGPQGRSGGLSLTYQLSHDAIDIEVTGSFDDPPVDGSEGLSRQILSAVVDSFEFEPDQPSVTLHKRLSS